MADIIRGPRIFQFISQGEQNNSKLWKTRKIFVALQEVYVRLLGYP